jgi:PhnB protein
MTTLTPYILFDGNCQQAMEFYKSCFGGELTVLKVKDSPAKDHMPPSVQDKILNSQLRSGKIDFRRQTGYSLTGLESKAIRFGYTCAEERPRN